MENGEGLLNIVFKGDGVKELPDRLADLHVNKEDVNHYLDQLSTLGLSKLTREVDRIAEERAALINQTQELAFQEYPTFIETAQCTQEIFQSFQKVSHNTEKLTSSLTTLKERCVEFSQTAQSLNSARRLTSLALSKHTQLLEILELPQLMDTCVRNGYWEEALDLAAYVARLERKLAYIPLVVKVAQEVQSCTRLMLVQLIAQLRMPAQLPHCLKVVGYLRRMGVFSEEEIRIKFLQARDAWFKSTLDELPKDDAYQHVLKTVELSRVHLFDIATQYRAIFTDEDPLVLANQDPNTNESAIFHSWVIQKVTDFLLTLQTDLPKVSPSSLESVFGQCMYFGLSFGRIGSDFRALLVPLFSQIVYDRFERAANQAESLFADSVSSFSLKSVRNSASNHPAYLQSGTTTADQVQPPYTLMKFTPVAELCNAFISAFNELRLCAPVQLVQPVTRKVELTLRACSQILSDFQRQEKEAFTPSEEQEFGRCLQLFRQDFLPYIQKLLGFLFPVHLLAAQTGFPTSEITKQEPGLLNKESILQPIAHLVVNDPPQVTQVVESIQKLHIEKVNDPGVVEDKTIDQLDNETLLDPEGSSVMEQTISHPRENQVVDSIEKLKTENVNDSEAVDEITSDHTEEVVNETDNEAPLEPEGSTVNELIAHSQENQAVDSVQELPTEEASDSEGVEKITSDPPGEVIMQIDNEAPLEPEGSTVVEESIEADEEPTESETVEATEKPEESIQPDTEQEELNDKKNDLLS